MHTLVESLNLSKLYQGCVFHSDQKVATHQHVASALADHDLQWRRGTVNTALYQARINRLQMMALRYGAEVEVTPRPFEDFALVHTSLKGCTEFDCDGHRVAVPQGRTAIIAPKKHIRMVWGEGSEQLIVKLPHALLREMQGQATRGAGAPGALPGLAPGLLLAPALGQHWEMMLHSLLSILALPATESGHTAWIDHYERNVALFLLAQQGQGAPKVAADAQAAASGQGLTDDGAGKRLDALERYMRSKLCAPVALADLALAAGMSVRSLNQLCQRHHGVSPMELLRNMRLDAAHAHLQAHAEAGVADTALAFGFGHAGRFAAYYRARHGHLPRSQKRMAPAS